MVRTEKMTKSDWAFVSLIYHEGIATGMATFETDIPSWKEWDANHLKTCRIVAKMKDEVVGWAALSPVSSRCVYGGVAEVSVYVARKARGKGIGKILLDRLIVESESDGFWTLQAGIFPENKTSIKLHQKSGFRIIGYREKIGCMDGVWKDNILLERRSTVTGL